MLCPFILYRFPLATASGNEKFCGSKKPRPAEAGRGVPTKQDWGNIFSSKNNQFVADNTAAGIKPSQTFTIILPNLIHKSKKRNLKR